MIKICKLQKNKDKLRDTILNMEDIEFALFVLYTNTSSSKKTKPQKIYADIFNNEYTAEEFEKLLIDNTEGSILYNFNEGKLSRNKDLPNHHTISFNKINSENAIVIGKIESNKDDERRIMKLMYKMQYTKPDMSEIAFIEPDKIIMCMTHNIEFESSPINCFDTYIICQKQGDIIRPLEYTSFPKAIVVEKDESEKIKIQIPIKIEHLGEFYRVPKL